MNDKKIIDPPSVYVGTYKKYNLGNLSGDWVDLTKFSNKNEFINFCLKMHSEETDPELMFQDFTGFPTQLYSETTISEHLWDWLKLNEFQKQIIEAFLCCFGGNFETALDKYEDAYMGEHDSFRDFCEDDFIENNSVPRHLEDFIDYDAVERHLDCYYIYHNGHVFTRDW